MLAWQWGRDTTHQREHALKSCCRGSQAEVGQTSRPGWWPWWSRLARDSSQSGEQWEDPQVRAADKLWDVVYV